MSFTEVKILPTDNEQTLVAQWVKRGYVIRGVKRHEDGTWLTFGPPTNYHSLDVNNQWQFDKQAWLDAEVRPERDALLTKSDVMMLHDIRMQLNASELQQWKTYRQSLRDLPANIITNGGPVQVTWPSKPTTIINVRRP